MHKHFIIRPACR